MWLANLASWVLSGGFSVLDFIPALSAIYYMLGYIAKIYKLLLHPHLFLFGARTPFPDRFKFTVTEVVGIGQ